MASSMTMPTDKVRASRVIEFNVKPSYQIRPNVAMMEVGIATAAMIVDRQFHRKIRTTAAARIPNHPDVVTGRHERTDIGQPLLDGVDDLHGVRA